MKRCVLVIIIMFVHRKIKAFLLVELSCSNHKVLHHAYSCIFLFLLLQGSKKKTNPDPQLQVSTTDVTTRAGLVKMLLQPHDKMRYKELREGKNTISHSEGF